MMKKNTTRIFYLIILAIICFAYGVSVGHYKFSPFKTLQKIKQKTSLTNTYKYNDSNLDVDEILVKYAFNDPVDTNYLVHSPIDTIDKLREVNEKIFIKTSLYKNVYEKIKIDDIQEIKLIDKNYNIIKITYNIYDKLYSTFAYGSLPETCNKNIASLIIPGSGLNQSEGIINNDSQNYHFGIIDSLNNKVEDIFVFIKPNEDALAWSNNKKNKKIGINFYLGWHLDRGGTYSVAYLTQSIAFVKWMKSCYKKTILAGLSQGGLAVLLNALQTSPTLAIVASGFSTIELAKFWKGYDQMLGVPGYFDLMNNSNIYETLSSSNTSWLFSWGLEENAFNQMEAEKKITAKKKIPGLHPDRAQFVQAGLLIISTIMGFLNLSSLVVCDRGLRWGVLRKNIDDNC